jgi:hypothetical protein
MENYTTFILGEFEVFRENFENTAKVPADTGGSKGVQRVCENHVWFEDRWMVASLCDE